MSKLEDYDLIDDTIFVHIVDSDIELTEKQEIALSILYDTDFEGCCACDTSDPIYLEMEKLEDIVPFTDCFEYANCANGNCIHIWKLSKLIKYLIPSYPFDFDEHPEIDSEMRDYVSNHINDKNFIAKLQFRYKIVEHLDDNKQVFNEAQDKFISHIRRYSMKFIETNDNDIEKWVDIIHARIKDVPAYRIEQILRMFVDEH